MADPIQPDPDAPRGPLTEMLLRLGRKDGARICVDDIIESEGRRAYAALLFALSAPNIVPILPPGVVTGAGLLLMIISLQMLIGIEPPRLPGWLRRRGVSSKRFNKGARKLLPRLQRLEGVLKPRLRFLVAGLGQRLIALVCLLMSILILVPIPFANMVPGGAVAILALALSQEDGLLALGGVGVAGASLGVALAIYRLGGMGAVSLHGLFKG